MRFWAEMLGLFTLSTVGVLAALHAQSSPPSVPQWQIDAGGKLAFDVASVKQNKSGSVNGSSNILLTPGDILRPTGGRFSLTNAQLRQLIQFAYKLPLGAPVYFVPALPDRLDAERFDVEAKADVSTGKDQFRLMVQSLLADRFKLMVHRETRQRPIYVLVLSKAGKIGPHLTPHTDDTKCDAIDVKPAPGTVPSRFPCGEVLGAPPSVPGRRGIHAWKVSMATIATTIVGFGTNLDRPVVDQTGLGGTFDFSLEWTPEPSPGADVQADVSGPTLSEALNEQLGLKLEPRTGPVDVLVIDHIEEPSPN
jgi:uncharacterized protein (TIGR03435 family)